jgi:hypothetical protein
VASRTETLNVEVDRLDDVLAADDVPALLEIDVDGPCTATGFRDAHETGGRWNYFARGSRHQRRPGGQKARGAHRGTTCRYVGERAIRVNAASAAGDESTRHCSFSNQTTARTCG